jgi:arylsulfatase A-like enzyme
MWLFYERADKFIEKLENKVPDDTFILVISDHGMQRNGVHSDHAFYSTNTLLGLRNPKITDFYGIITEKLATK